MDYWVELYNFLINQHPILSMIYAFFLILLPALYLYVLYLSKDPKKYIKHKGLIDCSATLFLFFMPLFFLTLEAYSKIKKFDLSNFFWFVLSSQITVSILITILNNKYVKRTSEMILYNEKTKQQERKIIRVNATLELLTKSSDQNNNLGNK